MSSVLVDILATRAAEQPTDEAFRFLEANGTHEAWDYATLNRRARGVASRLRSSGATGRPVLLVYPSGLAFIAALLGCFYAGAIAVPVPVLTPRRAFDRAAAICGDAGPVLGLTLASLMDQLPDADPAVRGLPWIASDDLEDDETGAFTTERQAVALLQYTSGTTSRPRGVVVTHDNLMHNLAAILSGGVRRPDDRAVSWLPMHHDMGLIFFALFPIFCAIPCVLMSPLTFLQRPMRWLEALSDYGGTLSSAPCFAYDLCVRRTTPEQRAKLDLSRWRWAVCGAEVVRPDVLEAFGAAFAVSGFYPGAWVPAYGLAENTLFVASNQGLVTRDAALAELAQGRVASPRDAAASRRLTSCGQPALDQQLAIVEPEGRRRLAQDEIGEIWVRGKSVARGYWRDAAATSATFEGRVAGEDDGVWLRTGDLGAIGADGLVVTGRRKDLIIIRGANFDPLDLEVAAIAAAPADLLGAGAAFAVDAEEGETVVLVQEVERAAVGRVDFGAMIGAIASGLSTRFGLTLHDLVFVRPGALPRTTSGKIQRHLCRRNYLAGEFARLYELPHPALSRWRPRRS